METVNLKTQYLDKYRAGDGLARSTVEEKVASCERNGERVVTFHNDVFTEFYSVDPSATNAEIEDDLESLQEWNRGAFIFADGVDVFSVASEGSPEWNDVRRQRVTDGRIEHIDSDNYAQAEILSPLLENFEVTLQRNYPHADYNLTFYGISEKKIRAIVAAVDALSK